MTDLGTLGGITGGGLAINDRGQVTGWASVPPDSSKSHAFFYSDGVMIDIGTFGGKETLGLAINNRGQVVGWGHLPGDTETHAFLYSDGAMIDINPAGWSKSQAFGINDQGQIVGYGVNTNGRLHAFRLDPIRDQTPPAITLAATPDTLWPPNGRIIPVMVSGTITDVTSGTETASGVDPTATTYAVTDEYGLIEPTGPIPMEQNPDGSYAFTINIPLQASRNDNDRDGRQYTITVSAFDNADNEGSKNINVRVPHNLAQDRSLATR
jgi:probable HAF family extracellular repeat protein